MSCAQDAPTDCDDDHAKYLSLKGACVGVGSMRGLGVTWPLELHPTFYHLVTVQLGEVLRFKMSGRKSSCPPDPKTRFGRMKKSCPPEPKNKT
jgi:hypothetical protein